MTPYYERGNIVLYLGDCREVLAAGISAGVPIGCTLADPPYGETSLEWDRWPDAWPGVVGSFVPDLSSLWCFGSLRMFLAHGGEFTGWKLAQDVVWEKHNGSSPSADRFRRVHELVAHWYRGPWEQVWKDPVTTPDALKKQVRRKRRTPHWGDIGAGHYASEDGGPRLARSVQYVPSTHGYADHPTQKPAALLDVLLRYSLAPDRALLDPFAGSGAALVAARRLGRAAIGIEAQERYCEVTAKALAKELL